MTATLNNNITFDGQKTGNKIQGNYEAIRSEKCFEPNTNYNKGKDRRILSCY